MFAIWCGGTPGLDITARVTHRLSAYRGLPYAEAAGMRDRAVAALLKRCHRDNQLLPLDTRFGDKLATIKDAVAIYFHGNGRQKEALKVLRRHAQRRGEQAYWEGKASWGYWGGELEATCDAARVMFDAGDPLFRPAFNYVGGKVINGGLHSTADTRALVELLDFISLPGEPLARIDGVEIQPGELAVGQEVMALRDNLVVRVDEEIVIDHLAPRNNFRFVVEVRPSKLKLGGRASVIITLEEDSICPLARIYLPGCLALLKGGANAQTAHLPVGVEGIHFWRNTRLLQVEAVAVRKGHGNVHVAVHDLYDAQQIGTHPGVAVIVD